MGVLREIYSRYRTAVPKAKKVILNEFDAGVVVGTSVILFDPIFSGAGDSLMAGEVASTVLLRMTVPVLYYLSQRERGGDAPILPVESGTATHNSLK